MCLFVVILEIKSEALCMLGQCSPPFLFLISRQVFPESPRLVHTGVPCLSFLGGWSYRREPGSWLILVLFSSGFWCWGLNPGLHACWASALPLSCFLVLPSFLMGISVNYSTFGPLFHVLASPSVRRRPSISGLDTR